MPSLVGYGTRIEFCPSTGIVLVLRHCQQICPCIQQQTNVFGPAVVCERGSHKRQSRFGQSPRFMR